MGLHTSARYYARYTRAIVSMNPSSILRASGRLLVAPGSAASPLRVPSRLFELDGSIYGSVGTVWFREFYGGHYDPD